MNYLAQEKIPQLSWGTDVKTSGTRRWNVNTKQENGCFVLLRHAQIYCICTTFKEGFNYVLLLPKQLLLLPSHSISDTGNSTPINVQGIHMHLPFVSETQGQRCEEAFSWGLSTPRSGGSGLVGDHAMSELSAGCQVAELMVKSLINTFSNMCVICSSF